MAQRLVQCPRCDAKTEKEAETMCRPGVDECPMTECDDWEEMLGRIWLRIESDERVMRMIERQERWKWLRRFWCRIVGHRFSMTWVSENTWTDLEGERHHHLVEENFGHCIRCGADAHGH